MFKEITDKNLWNDLVLASSSTDILQSWEWGEAKRIEGWIPFRFALVDENLLDPNFEIAAMGLVKKAGPLGNLLYMPHAPVFADQAKLANFFKPFSEGLIAWAKANNVFLIELEPKLSLDNELLNTFADHGFKITGRNRQPIYKLTIDLNQSEEEILANMEKNTRYNIGYAERKGVVINQYPANHPEIEQKIDKFYELLLETQERTKGYPIRSKAYFQNLFKVFADSNKLSLFEAVYEGEVIAINISEFTPVWASSFYAGSSRSHSNVKATYLLRWKSIQEAKSRGCKIYDFWGIVPNSNQHKGYSDHKLSFGGDRVDFVGILEYQLSFKAKIWPIVLKLRGLV